MHINCAAPFLPAVHSGQTKPHGMSRFEAGACICHLGCWARLEKAAEVHSEEAPGIQEVWLQCRESCWKPGVKEWGAGVGAVPVNPRAPSCGGSCAGLSAASGLGAGAAELVQLHNSRQFVPFHCSGDLKRVLAGKAALGNLAFLAGKADDPGIVQSLSVPVLGAEGVKVQVHSPELLCCPGCDSSSSRELLQLCPGWGWGHSSSVEPVPAGSSARLPCCWECQSPLMPGVRGAAAPRGTWQISPVQEHGSVGDAAWKDC